MPKVSIIVPVYNVEKYIEKCINSIIQQTEKDFELILVDDGSKDLSGKICDEYAEKDKRIRVIHKKNEGPSIARNKGLDICKGEYITFIDSDDYIEIEYLANMLNKAKRNDADIVMCGFRQIFKGNSEKHCVEKDLDIDKEEFIKGLLVQKGYGLCRCKLYKYESIRNNRFDENLTVGEDTYFNLLVSRNIHKCVYIKDILYNYNVNQQSIVRRYNENYLENYIRASVKTKEYILENFNDNNLKRLTNNYIIFTLTLVIVNYCCNPERNSGKIVKEIKDIKRICNIDEYKKALKDIEFKYFSTTRKIMVISLKLKLYLIVSIIGNIRQLQVRGKSK